jgi:hypothetical protein
MIQGTFGVEVENKFRIALNVLIYFSEKNLLNGQSTTIGIQINPELLTKK